MILFLGDTHGDPLLYRVLEKAHAEGITDVVQTGDFGIHWPTGKPCPYYQYFHKRDIQQERAGPRVRTCGGNHDAYHKLQDLDEQGRSDEHEIYYTPRCSYVRRGSILEIQGLRIMFLGGAESSDVQTMPATGWSLHGPLGRAQYPEPFKTLKAKAKAEYKPAPGAWWEEESVTAEDIDRAERYLREQPADIWVTHDGPVRARPHRIGGAVLPNGKVVGSSAVLLEDLYERAKHKPAHWFYGHHHKDTRSYSDSTRFYCCGIVQTDYKYQSHTSLNGWVLDPTSGRVSPWTVHER